MVAIKEAKYYFYLKTCWIEISESWKISFSTLSLFHLWLHWRKPMGENAICPFQLWIKFVIFVKLWLNMKHRYKTDPYEQKSLALDWSITIAALAFIFLTLTFQEFLSRTNEILNRSHGSVSCDHFSGILIIGSRRWNWKFREKYFWNPNPELLLHSSYSFWPWISTSGSCWDLASTLPWKKCEKYKKSWM